MHCSDSQPLALLTVACPFNSALANKMKTLKFNHISKKLIITGTVYSAFVFIIGASCTSTNCLGLIVFGAPIAIGGMPWSIVIDLIFPSSQADKPFLDSINLFGFISIYLCFIFNLWLLGKGILWFSNRKKVKKQE